MTAIEPVRYEPRAGLGQQECLVHTVTEALGYSGDRGPRSRPLVNRPYRFVARFVGIDGKGWCDRCVADGFRRGSVDITNPVEFIEAAPEPVLEDGRDIRVPTEPEAVIEVRRILIEGEWGVEALDSLERALEAAGRAGALPRLAARLLAAARELAVQ